MRGTSFHLVFPETANEGVDQRVHITAPTTSTQSCTITVTSTAFSHDPITLAPGASVTLTIPHAVQTRGIGISSKTVLLSGDNVFTVRTQSGGDGSCGAYQASPVDSYGNDYRIAAWWPEVGGQNYGQFDVVAALDDTQVTVTILKGKGVNFEIDGVSYNQDNPYTTTLQTGEMLQIQNKMFSDITGTRIQSNRPVGVVSGLLQTNIGPNGKLDHALEQMPPINTWGVRFAMVSHTANARYRVKVITSTDYTVIKYNGLTSVIRLAGDFSTLTIDGPTFLVSSSPVLVVMFTEGTARDSPSMILVPHISQYRTSYTASAVQAESYAAVVRYKDDQSLTMDGVNVHTDVQWFGVDGDWRVGKLGLLAGDHVITTSDLSHGIGIYIYTSSGNGRCSSAFTPDVCLDMIVSYLNYFNINI